MHIADGRGRRACGARGVLFRRDADGTKPRATGAALFIWVWLVASILNGAVGVFRAGIPLINEIGAFIPIFGIPAAIAWYLAYRHGR